MLLFVGEQCCDTGYKLAMYCCHIVVHEYDNKQCWRKRKTMEPTWVF